MPLNEFFKRLLGHSTGETSCTMLRRSGRYMASYEAWVADQAYLKWAKAFFKSYHYTKAGMAGPLRVQAVRDTHLQGVILFYDPSIGEGNFSFLFNLLKDRVQALGYTLHCCDKLKIRHTRYTEQVEKHLLTPPASDLPGTSLCNQLYGNILLDFIRVNRRPGYIRFIANAYNDAHFSQPLPFDDLLEKALQPHEKEKK